MAASGGDDVSNTAKAVARPAPPTDDVNALLRRAEAGDPKVMAVAREVLTPATVSYTHLTLPTIYSV